METQRTSRLVWQDRSDTEIERAQLPHLPDGQIYGWMTMDGTVYSGPGYPVPRQRFALDTRECAAVLVKRAETPAGHMEAAARALGLHRIPGGTTAMNPPTRWPTCREDTLSGRDGTVPLTWDFADKCREDARIVAAALGGGAPCPDIDGLAEDLSDFAGRIDRFGFVNALPGHAATLRAAIQALNSPTRPLAWFDAADGRPADMSRILMLYGDGSGGYLCFWSGVQLYDEHGEETDWPTDDGAMWTYLPGGFRLWCEMLETDATIFPS